MNLGSLLNSNGISYYRQGEGEPLLLIHGVGLCAQSWYQQIETLSKSFDVIAIDLPGHGQSKALATDSPEVGHFAQAIANFIEEQLDGSAHIIGHSLGALIALDLACNHANTCRNMIALTTIYQRSDSAKKAVQARASTLAIDDITDVAMTPLLRWFPVSDTENYAEYVDHCARWLNDANTKHYAAAYHAFANAVDLPDQSIHEIACPALFITGELDPNSTPAMSHSLAQLIPAGKVTIIENARHMLQLTHALQVNQAIHDFLAQAKHQSAGAL